MNGTNLFILQFVVSLIAYILLATWYVFPRIKNLPLKKALIPLIWIHVFRNIGLSIMAPDATDAIHPEFFKMMIGYGDVLAAFLAILSLVFIHYRIKGALILVWIFSIIGTLDLINAFYQSILIDAFMYSIGTTWVIVTMYVPALWVSSAMIFYLLIKKNKSID